MDFRHLLNGLIDGYLYRSGRLDTTLSFPELRRRSLINDAARDADGAADFSERIRSSLPMSANSFRASPTTPVTKVDRTLDATRVAVFVSLHCSSCERKALHTSQAWCAPCERSPAVKRTHGFVLLILLSSLAPVAPTISPALAQSITINRDGIKIERRSSRINRAEATRIARRHGIDRVIDSYLRGRYWTVTGETGRRRELLRLTIDERNGRVVGRRYIRR
jgi:hypothetical protein